MDELYQTMDTFIIRKDAFAVIWRAWISFKQRKIFQIMRQTLQHAVSKSLVDLKVLPSTLLGALDDHSSDQNAYSKRSRFSTGSHITVSGPFPVGRKYIPPDRLLQDFYLQHQCPLFQWQKDNRVWVKG